MFTKKVKFLLFVGFVVIVGIFALGNFSNSKNSNEEKLDDSMVSTVHPDLLTFSIVPNAKVHGILSYRGSIKGGYFFEGNIRIIILDADKNVLKESNGIAKSEWMIEGPVDFEGNIDFTGMPSTSGYFRIANDNPSGDPENDKFIDIPIVIN